MKRFYEDISVLKQDKMYVVMLDGKTIKTPQKNLCLLSTRVMADAVAKEWEDQDKNIDPASMPMTKMINTAIDRVEVRRNEIITELVNFSCSDQICYRADNPQELVDLQNKIWNPLLMRLKKVHNIEDFALMAFYGMVTVCGSITIGLNLFEGYISTDEAWKAGHLDENFQVSKWGNDQDADDRRANLKDELENSVRFHSLCK
jgi:chaperone required for assembly of F1-ATPase